MICIKGKRDGQKVSDIKYKNKWFALIDKYRKKKTTGERKISPVVCCARARTFQMKLDQNLL